MLLKCIDNIEVEIIENEKFDFLMDTSNVAKGYGTNEANIRNAKRNNPGELIEGKHYFTDKSKGKKMFWTKKGIVRLGFFIKSEDAKKFRDWAEDYIVNEKSSNSDLQKILDRLEKQNQEIQNLKNQIAVKTKKLEAKTKPKNPFKGYYENKNRPLGQRENEYLYSRNDWMMLLNECETQLGLERTGKGKTLLLSRGVR